MNRRHWMARLACSCFVTVGALAQPSAQRAGADEKVSLKNTLENGLYCRKPNEFAFVALVAQKVEQRQLSSEVVLSMFKWSRERRPHFPFPYFEAGLRHRAAALGVEL